MFSAPFCDFETARFRIQITTDRFAAVSKSDANPVALPDLVQGAFFILDQTPVKAIGLNRQMHFDLPSEAVWHHFGDKLAPKEGWSAVLPSRAGMRSLSIESLLGTDPDGPKITVKVEPSMLIKFGVYFDTNENYPVPSAVSSTDSMTHLMGILRQRWEESYSYAAKIAENILDWGTR